LKKLKNLFLLVVFMMMITIAPACTGDKPGGEEVKVEQVKSDAAVQEVSAEE